MKKLLLLLIVLISCEKQVYYYPSEDFFKEKKPKEINIDDLSFGELVDSIQNQIFKKRRHYIKIENSNKIYKISPFTYAGGLIKERNALDIENDSIWWKFEKKPLRDLDKFIELHYANKGKKVFLPYSFKKGFVKFTLDSSLNNSKTKEKLLYVINSWENAQFENKDSCNLEILIHYWKDPKGQPLPPLNLFKR